MRLHLASALVGAAALGAVLIGASAFQAPTGSTPTRQMVSSLGLTIDGRVRVDGIPAPSELLRVIEGQPLTVPVGKVFVAVSLGSLKGGLHTTEVHFNGAKVYQAVTDGGVVEIPRPYLGAPAGTVVTAEVGDTDPNDAQIWGYLADF